jgi:serine/threonine-protein kinase HipA
MSIITKLQVWYCGWGERWLLGTLAQAGGVLLFEYSAQAMEHAALRGLEFSPLHAQVPKAGSQHLALAGPSHFSGVPGFIADALPDGWGMLLMDRAFRKAGRNVASVSVLERLAVVGASAMGALEFEPADPLQAQALGVVALQELALETERVLADQREQTPAEQLRRLMALGGSPQGARPKALLRWSSITGRYQADAAGEDAGEPWLIKFPAQGERAEVSSVEELYARLARAGGIEMPASRCIKLDAQRSAFGVRRFDRVSVGPSREVRVPMLSMAALLNADFRLPSLDYENVLLATARLTGDHRETVKAFERCVFNVLTHNRDDHAKNFAFTLGADDRWRLSPAFDLTFSFGPGGEHSTAVAGEGKLPGRAALLRVAKAGGVKPSDAQRVIAHWLEALQPRLALLNDLEIRKSTVEHMRKQMQAIWKMVEAQA